MAPKKSKTKTEVVKNLAKGWKKCKMTESDITALVDERLLQSHAIIQWHHAVGEDRQYDGTNEIVLFCDFVERNLAIPASDFLHALLKCWGIQLHHLTHQSILHLSIFTHLCEAFIGIEPHFYVFQHFFFLLPHPNASKPVEVGGAELDLRPENQDEYLFYQPSGKGIEWKSFWLYIENHQPSILEWAPKAPKAKGCWASPSPGGDQVQNLRTTIARLKKVGVTGG